MNSTFWNGKRVFITGHTGFKGSWLSLWLKQLGAEVSGFSLAPKSIPCLFEVANVADGMISNFGDITNIDELSKAIQEFQPEIVFHMAAQALVRYSYLNPMETYKTNVMGTVHLFEVIRNTSSIRAVVNVTSDKCYENKEWPWGYRENEPMGGYDPYSNSKGCAELVTSAYRSSYFNKASYAEHKVAIASVRAGNVVGGGDWAEDRLIPDFMRAILRREAVVIRSPESVRPWQHVLEPLSGYLLLAEYLYKEGVNYAEGWNFGPFDEDAKPVKWIVEELTNLWGNGATWKLDENLHPHEAKYLKLDISKARTYLDWKPRWSLERALSNIVDWYKAWESNKNMNEYTNTQIISYMES